jgi:hypothetical protein
MCSLRIWVGRSNTCWNLCEPELDEYCQVPGLAVNDSGLRPLPGPEAR